MPKRHHKLFDNIASSLYCLLTQNGRYIAPSNRPYL